MPAQDGHPSKAPAFQTLHIKPHLAVLQSQLTAGITHPVAIRLQVSPDPAAMAMAVQEQLAGIAALLKCLAVDPTTQPASSSPLKTPTLKIPGETSAEKSMLEFELAALVLRVQKLEARANSPAAVDLPNTPNESGDEPTSDKVGSPPALPQNGLLDEALEGLKEHVEDQSKLLQSQRRELEGVNAQLVQQKELQEEALAVIEKRRVASLERELWKHQKANEAFQKALREIGEIVTAVARGDLSKKVRMNSVEMDPEITTFKRTINTMMDQLQVFSSEVSRVAREVGTEGMLGGQARIEGVDGTWKELTDNGAFSNVPWPFFSLRNFPRARTDFLLLVNVMAQNLTDQGMACFE